MKKRITIIITFVLALLLAACKAASPSTDNFGLGQEVKNFAVSERKIIYSVSFSIEQRDFAAAMKIVEDSLKEDEWF